MDAHVDVTLPQDIFDGERFFYLIFFDFFSFLFLFVLIGDDINPLQGVLSVMSGLIFREIHFSLRGIVYGRRRWRWWGFVLVEG